MERTDAERMAAKLDGMVSAGVLPGLLPDSVLEAAKMLRDQERELKSLRTALAAKDHVVSVTLSDSAPYQKDVRAEFVITSPRIYYAAMRVDDRWTHERETSDWTQHVARQLARTGTAEWIREIEDRTYAGLRLAITAGARSAETEGLSP
jgi:hypothetical protein